MTREKKFDSVAKSSAIAVLEDELKIRSVVYAEHISHGGKADCGEEFYLDALKMAIAALREQTVTNCHQLNGWISVKDRLPEELPEYKDRKVIPCIVHLASCYPNGKGNTQKRQRQQVTDYDGKPCGWEWSRIGKSRVTHWMPLPEPPEVDV